MNNSLRILMLEDNTDDVEILQYFLRAEKPSCIFKVVMTENDFIDALKTFNPDVILSDNTMPQYSAKEALNLFKQYKLNIPFILVTGTVSEEFAAGIIKSGADDYILKDRLIRLPAAIDAALQKKRIEAAKEKAEETIRFNADLLNKVGQAVIATNIEGKVLYWNKAAEDLYGWTSEEALGENIINLTPSLQTKEDAAEIMRMLSTGKSWSGEFLVKRKDGKLFPALVTDSPFFDQQGNVSGIIGVSIDISERKKVEENLLAMEKKIAAQKIQEQKKISRAIIKAQEEEKNYIGQELHDNINQILAGAKMYLKMAAKKSDSMNEILSYPIELIDNSIQEIRRLTFKQVTPLKNINLQEQIESLLETIQYSTQLQVDFHFQATESAFSDDLKLNVYRIIQEQLNNVLKHAHAKNISIDVLEEEENMLLIIVDDGIGFDSTADRKGIGISNMMNRVKSYDGMLDIISSAGNGCMLRVTIPFA